MKKIFFPILLLLSLLTVLTACGNPLARPDLLYVLDNAEVLSEETEEKIIGANRSLKKLCGAEVAVVCVDSTGKSTISETAEKIYADWGIGDETRNNGILLLLAVKDEDYRSLQGKGLEGLISSDEIREVMANDLEPHFAAGEYDEGVSAFFDSIIGKLEEIYHVKLSPEVVESDEKTGGGFFRVFGIALLIVLILLVLFILIVLVLRVFNTMKKKREIARRKEMAKRRRIAQESILRRDRRSR